MNAFGSPTRMLVCWSVTYITRASNAKSTSSRNLLAKLNRVAFTEFFDDDRMVLKRIKFELLRVLDAHRAATDERPEPRVEPKSGRRRKPTRCLRGIALNQEFMAHGEGEGRRSVSACSQPCSQHATPGRVKARTGDWTVCAHIAPMTCEPAGRNLRGLRTLALSTLRLTTLLAKTQDGASQRPRSALAGPMFVWCCCAAVYMHVGRRK